MRYLTAVAVVLMATGCYTPVATDDSTCDALAYASPEMLAWQQAADTYTGAERAHRAAMEIAKGGDLTDDDKDYLQETHQRKLDTYRAMQAARLRLDSLGCRFNKITGKVELYRVGS